MKVHDEDACGDTFDDLAHDLTALIRRKRFTPAIHRLEQCKEARLDAAAHHGEIDASHISVYNLVEWLRACLCQINKKIKFAEAYGGKTTITYYDAPMRFIIQLAVKQGTRTYIIKSTGYDYEDKLAGGR